MSEDKANAREAHYKEEIKRLTQKLKQAETRSEFAERSVGKLQKEVNSLNVHIFFQQNNARKTLQGWRKDGQKTDIVMFIKKLAKFEHIL